MTGAPISFSDCRIERYDKQLAWSARHFRDLEAQAGALIGAPWLTQG